ncbi:MAG: hypothetical protein DWQ08_12935 [Proteobacteria bacterium]|nr:MAG: hypothetical protein DWQ08_12935 [Pseudomonadota bacterium]
MVTSVTGNFMPEIRRQKRWHRDRSSIDTEFGFQSEVQGRPAGIQAGAVASDVLVNVAVPARRVRSVAPCRNRLAEI